MNIAKDQQIVGLFKINVHLTNLTIVHTILSQVLNQMCEA